LTSLITLTFVSLDFEDGHDEDDFSTEALELFGAGQHRGHFFLICVSERFGAISREALLRTFAPSALMSNF
jgi:hypothetical protein